MLLSKSCNENSIKWKSKRGYYILPESIKYSRFLSSTITADLLLKLRLVTMEEMGLPLSSKQRAVKSRVSQLIPSHTPIHSRPSSPPGVSSFACHEAAVLWGPLSVKQLSHHKLLIEMQKYQQSWLGVLISWAVPVLSQHLAQDCWFGCFSAASTLSFSVALAAKCSCSKHSPNCTWHPVLALVQVSPKAANTPLRKRAPGWLY